MVVERPTFQVDTNLFRELGELLVGRDSTALAELIKNSYDADASEVLVLGERLDNAEEGRIQILDNGDGMSLDDFVNGFLRIAGRTKLTETRRTRRYQRRFTGSKGIGRLAAHKLAKFVRITSTYRPRKRGEQSTVLKAHIDWDAVEMYRTLDEIKDSGAIQYQVETAPRGAPYGTSIELSRLRKSWTEKELVHFVAEVHRFQIPEPLLGPLPTDLIDGPLLFERVVTRDASGADPGFDVNLDGDFEVGEEFWPTMVRQADWVIEIDAASKEGVVDYVVAPLRARPWEGGVRPAPATARIAHPHPKQGPYFQGRIFVREYRRGVRAFRDWADQSAGIRLYMEGFRVLPYGDIEDDWLRLNYQYSRRLRELNSPQTARFVLGTTNKDASLMILGNAAYFGGLFLTERGAAGLRMLVNREGFVPDTAFNDLADIVTNAIALSVRVRAAYTQPKRERRRAQSAAFRTLKAGSDEFIPTPGRIALVGLLNLTTSRIKHAADAASSGDFSGVVAQLKNAAKSIEEAKSYTDLAIDEEAMIHIMASIGLQLSSFVHEINRHTDSLRGAEADIERLRRDEGNSHLGRELAKLNGTVSELRRGLDRQSSFLSALAITDAGRKRFPQLLHDRFEIAIMLVDAEAKKRSVGITNAIDWECRTGPMFPAELAMIMTNLLTNAVKFAGENGSIRASC